MCMFSPVYGGLEILKQQSKAQRNYAHNIPSILSMTFYSMCNAKVNDQGGFVIPIHDTELILPTSHMDKLATLC